MVETMEWFFLREKPTLALMAVGELDPAYAALVAKRIDSTFPHTSNILSKLEEQGFIKSRSEGRIRFLELTDRGRNVFMGLKNLREALRAPGAYWRKANSLRDHVGLQAGCGSVLGLGPLRRDISRLKSVGDEELGRAAEELDQIILAAIRNHVLQGR